MPLPPFIMTYFPALISGILLTAAFPSTGLFPLAFFALVPLWVSLDALTPKQGFIAGIVTGLVHFSTLIYWIIPTLSTYGGLPPYAAAAVLLLLCGYLALYPGLFACILCRRQVPAQLAPIWGAAVWVGLEYIRTHALTGFAWGVLGYSQYTNLSLVQMADILGVLGVSFVLVLCNGCLAEFVTALRKSGHFPGMKGIIPLGYGVLVLALCLGYGHRRISSVTKEAAVAQQTRVAVIQGNIAQEHKWDAAFKSKTLDRYGKLSLKSLPADLVVWPETALPFYYGRDPVFSSRVDAIVRKSKSAFLIGSPAVEFEGETPRYFNRAYMLTPLGMVRGYYDKSHLVPFGEYVPLQDLLFFVDKLTQEAGNFSPGTAGQTPLQFSTHATGVLICFEILFPHIARNFVLNGADLLTTITNDAWFGRTSAPAQHVAIAVLRAVENRRSMVRAANTGISGFISPTGKIMGQTDLFTPASIVMEVPALTRTTFYTRHGDLIGIASLIAISAVFMVKRLTKTFRRKEP